MKEKKYDWKKVVFSFLFFFFFLNIIVPSNSIYPFCIVIALKKKLIYFFINVVQS